MKINQLIACLVFLTFVISSCKIGEDSPVREFFSFEIELPLDPVKDEYLNGDLLWLSTGITGKEFTDVSTGEVTKVGNGKFSFQIDVYDPFMQPDNTDKFSLAIQTGEVTEIDDFKETGSAILTFGCPHNSYAMQIGVQFNKPGGYLLFLNQDLPLPQVFFTEDEDCSLIPVNQIPPSTADIATVSYTFDVTDTNIDQFEAYATGFPDVIVDLGAIRTALENKQAYFVLVK